MPGENKQRLDFENIEDNLSWVAFRIILGDD